MSRSDGGAMARLIAGLLVLCFLAAAAGLGFARSRIEEEFQGFPGVEAVVTIPSGASVRESIQLLEQAGVLRNETLARLYWRFKLNDPVVKAGEYRFQGAASMAEVLARIQRGDVLTHRVTILEGQTYEEIARHLAAKGFGSYEVFLSEMGSPSRIVDLDGEATDLEGYLFPDTYAFARGTGESQIVDALVSTFRERLIEARALAAAMRSNTNQDAVAGSAPLELRDVVILASIVEKEALLDGERPIIAGVYANRLEIGMGLYADPTIIYALKKLGTWDGNLRRRDLEMESPYNTYRSVGLPPGPICSPGLASLAAALAPADVPYLYFVSRNDGSHVFARSLAEHNRNVHEWQKLYWRKRRAETAEGEKLH